MAEYRTLADRVLAGRPACWSNEEQPFDGNLHLYTLLGSGEHWNGFAHGGSAAVLACLPPSAHAARLPP